MKHIIKSMVQKYRLNLFIDGNCIMILSIDKYTPSLKTLTRVETGIYHKSVKRIYHKVSEADDHNDMFMSICKSV